MDRILLIYSTVDGHTRKIAERLREGWSAAGHETVLSSMDDDGEVDPAGFDRVVIGASIRYGKYRPNLIAYINRHADALQARPTAFFSVNLVARKTNRNDRDTNPYVRKLLQQVRWKPDLVAVFAGKLDYPRYGFLDRQVIRLIMWITKGPTDPRAVVDFTDWQQVDAFAHGCAALPAQAAGAAAQTATAD